MARSRRIHFGTDICHPDTPAPLAGCLLRLRSEGKLAEDLFRKIARQNSARLFGMV